MKINRLETHDRLLHFKQDQQHNIFQGAEDCLKKNRLSLGMQQHSPYIYIFLHPRTADDGVTKKLIWQPRLTRPEAQTNSYLFRAKSKSNTLEICWIIPPVEMWGQYKKGNVTESEIVTWSIEQYKTKKTELEHPLADDLDDDKIRNIYKLVALEIDQENAAEKLNLWAQPELDLSQGFRRV